MHNDVICALIVSGRKAPKTKPKTDVNDENDKPTHNARKRLSLGGQGWMDVDATPSTGAVCFYWTRRVLLVSLKTYFKIMCFTIMTLASSRSQWLFPNTRSHSLVVSHTLCYGW